MNKKEEFINVNNEDFKIGRNTVNYIGYIGSPIANTLVFNPEDMDQSAILLIGTSQIDLRKFDFSTITDIEINHVRYIREDMMDKKGKTND